MADHRNCEYAIDATILVRRLRSLYSHWREHRDELWGSCNAFAVATPTHEYGDIRIRYFKSSAVSIWLLGLEFPDTIMGFSDKQMHFLCSQTLVSLLEVDDVVKKSAKELVDVDHVVMHVKAEHDDGTTQMDAILHAIEAQEKSNVLGCIAGEAPEGKLLMTWMEKINSSSRIQLCDVTNGLGDLFTVKEADELTNVKKAAYLTASAMEQFVVPGLEKVIDEEKKVTHFSLMKDIEKAILEPAKIKVKLKADNVDLCYPPIFQSGWNFDLKPRLFSLILMLTQIKAYQVLLKAHEAAVGALKPGKKANAVYKAAYAVVEKEAPELIPNLKKSVGARIGLEFLESRLILNKKNERILNPGMVLNVSLGFQCMRSEAMDWHYALLLADTVIVTVNGCEVETSLSRKALEDVYDFDYGEEEEDERPQVKVEAKRTEALLNMNSRASLVESDEDEEERKWRKMKAFGKSRAGPSSSAPKRPKFRRSWLFWEVGKQLFGFDMVMVAAMNQGAREIFFYKDLAGRRKKKEMSTLCFLFFLQGFGSNL
ncbi:hypothetical protein L6452_20046 [Arctium lappa]|uniref:Uncharacterized protein n=1 Tax=Arctium lappa TaxID=4217 RepID=A0ACB9B9I1_ARCLA|nr:hypothetical protein L6452_20046 [Arctium lappa]